jgi:hypothetical protein
MVSTPVPPPASAVRVVLVVALSLLALFFTACATGPRPTLADGTTLDEPVGDAATDAVLANFSAMDTTSFTAGYTITNNFGPVIKEALVTHDGFDRRSITIGEVRYLLTEDGSTTCRLLTGDCAEGASDAAISDLQVTHQFYARSAAARLRNDASRRVGPTEGYSAVFAGQEATCVSVPVSGGSKVYCVTETGVLAAYQGPDVLIELTDYESRVTEDLFSRVG